MEGPCRSVVMEENIKVIRRAAVCFSKEDYCDPVDKGSDPLEALTRIAIEAADTEEK